MPGLVRVHEHDAARKRVERTLWLRRERCKAHRHICAPLALGKERTLRLAWLGDPIDPGLIADAVPEGRRLA
jgi:hypothetical protein